MGKADPKTLKCAIYTRKSTEEGLDQAFNSLDAQREACEAYIKSQAHEGWKLRPTQYDDGGISGGTMERPAMQRLLADVDAGLVDRRIEAAGPRAGMEDIPDRDTSRRQFGGALPVIARLQPEQAGHDRPERVARMGVILSARQRFAARHAAQDEDARVLARQRGKAAVAIARGAATLNHVALAASSRR